MKKLYTLFYTVNTFEKKEKELFNPEEVINKNHPTYEEVYRALDSVEVKPSKNVLKNILNFAKKKN